MKNIKFIIDSSCTMTKQLCLKYDVCKIPYSINDEQGNLIKDEFSSVQKNRISEKIDQSIKYRTSFLPNSILENYFDKFLKDYDTCIYFTSSTEFTGQYNSAKQCLSNYKKNQVIIVNTNATAAIIEEIILEAKRKIDSMPLLTECKITKIATDINSRSVTYFGFKNTNGLLYSGRINPVLLKMLKILRICYPLIKVENKNSFVSMLKNYNLFIDKMFLNIDKIFKKEIVAEDIESIYFLGSVLDENTQKELIAKIALRYKIPESQIIVRVTPLPIFVYTLKNSFGITIILKSIKK